MSMGNDYLGLPSNESAPQINETKFFEEDVARMISSNEFKHVEDPFLNNIAEDLKQVNSSQNVFVFPTKQEIYMRQPQTNIINWSLKNYENINWVVKT